MSKHKFVGEYGIRASKKMLYPYISTASGLAQWFADDVNVSEDKVFSIIWDGVVNKARMVAHRTNNEVRFEFIVDGDDDPNYVELKLEMNELTQEVFIRVTDYSEMDDDEESTELWENMMSDLKEIVGG